ncbi:GNAT family N-acetyltransferase [Pradoshia eiseniae]|uniref:GNAT family N-acetyltransferase n=1 Tax=Pradoshia eiseniae TaxID=2064768 RepID=A0A2S7MV64_9BACI|nr:GNAT family N-acetyltransferase [Pradoshia eiseniae]PQD93640.1 GNAT family N-acetyltransferase [Pradoshia eiseniae]
MLNVEIRRPKREDIKQINEFFETVITDTFNKEGIGEKADDIQDEIEIKKKYIVSDMESNGEERFFLIALNDGKIIGSIEYGPVSNLIRRCTNNVYIGLIEVGTVFVHPDFQRKGVGNLLLEAMYSVIRKKGIGEFCLDSGYTRAQMIWKKKFGEPDYLLKDYWGEGNDHMIWRINVSDCPSD